jgi:ring-1,2-phenylacetyl-CoA epoxidase subunit PaaE
VAVEFHTLTVADVRRETSDAVSVAFALPPGLADEYRFAPGQHLTLRATFDGAECRRSYSICTAPDDGELRVAVKKVEDGRFSSWVNEALKPGDAIDVMTPQGRFGLSPDPAAARTYLAIAAGSGITPVMSLARALLIQEPQSEFVLIYGNRTSQGIIFKEALDDLKDRFLDRFTVHHVLSREQQELPLLNGRIDADKIKALVDAIAPAAEIDHVFLCGPGGMIEDSKTALMRLGVPAARVHVEYFSADGAPVPPRPAVARETDREGEPVATAQLRLQGAVHLVSMRAGETIVDAGLRQGLDMPYSCRGGMCCTCRAMLTEGEVEMDQNYSLEPWELAAGYVLTCQSHPKTPRVAVDYDQV